MNDNITLNDHIIAHCNESMAAALFAERQPLWPRSCPEMSDIDFTRLGLMNRFIRPIKNIRKHLKKETKLLKK